MTFTAKIVKTALKGTPVKLEVNFQEVRNYAPLVKVTTPDLQVKASGGEEQLKELDEAYKKGVDSL